MTDYVAIGDKVINDPFGIDQHNALNDNIKAVREQALRCGIEGSNTRLVLAHGSFAFDETLSSGVALMSQAVSYDVDSAEGDPNFDTSPVPVVWFSLKEDGSGDDWGSNLYNIEPYMVSGTGDSSGFTVEIRMQDRAGTTSDNIKGTLYWFALGVPTGTE